MEKQKVEEAKVPSCNSRWSQEDGSEVKVCFTQKVLERENRFKKDKSQSQSHTSGIIFKLCYK